MNHNAGGKREGAGRPSKDTLDTRTRNWNIIVYPESAPEKWRELIDETHIEWVESPLHDKDVNADGELKKAHYHVLLLFDGPKSYEQVKKITDSINAPIPQRCHSVKGSIRYMVHKDNPEKAQYDWNKIVCHGGADLASLCAPTATERMAIQKDITAYIRDERIIEFADILFYAQANDLDDWYNVLMNYSTLSISTLIRSNRNKLAPKLPQTVYIDRGTGELLDPRKGDV